MWNAIVSSSFSWIILLILFAILQFCDWWSTVLIIKNGGHEDTNIIQTFIDKFGLEVGVAIPKLILTVVISAATIWLLPNNSSRLLLVVMVCIIYALVVGENFFNRLVQLGKFKNE